MIVSEPKEVQQAQFCVPFHSVEIDEDFIFYNDLWTKIDVVRYPVDFVTKANAIRIDGKFDWLDPWDEVLVIAVYYEC